MSVDVSALKAQATQLFKDTLPQLRSALQTNGAAALAILKTAGSEAIESSKTIIAKTEFVAEQVARGDVDPDSAKLSLEMYFLALDNVKWKATNQTIVAEIEQAKKALSDFKDIAIAVGTAALKIGAASIAL